MEGDAADMDFLAFQRAGEPDRIRRDPPHQALAFLRVGSPVVRLTRHYILYKPTQKSYT